MQNVDLGKKAHTSSQEKRALKWKKGTESKQGTEKRRIELWTERGPKKRKNLSKLGKKKKKGKRENVTYSNNPCGKTLYNKGLKRRDSGGGKVLSWEIVGLLKYGRGTGRRMIGSLPLGRCGVRNIGLG